MTRPEGAGAPLPRLRLLQETEEDLATCEMITICDERDGDVGEIWIDEYATVNTTRAQAIELARLLVAVPAMLEALEAAYECMNMMGDILNGMDAVTDEDVEAATPAFDKVRAALSLARGASDA